MLRGYLLIGILTTHLYLEPNLVEIFTGRGALPASLAEGFIVLSGIVTGYVYLPKYFRDGWLQCARQLWRRAGVLYLNSVGIVALTWVAIAWKQPGPQRPTLQDILGVLLLLRVGELRPSVLALFVIALLITPLWLWLVGHGKPLFVGISLLALWVPAQFLSGAPDELTMKLAWPALFGAGFLLGCYWPVLRSHWERLGASTRRRTMILLAAVTIISALAWEFLLFWNHHILVAYESTMPAALRELLFAIERGLLDAWSVISGWQDKATLGWFRVLLGAVWFSGLLSLAELIGPRLDRVLKGSLTLLGRGGLTSYIIQVVVGLALSFTVVPAIREIDNIWLSTATVIAAQVLTILLVHAWNALRCSTRDVDGTRPGQARPPHADTVARDA